MQEWAPREGHEEAMMQWQSQMRPLLHQDNKVLCETCLAVLWQSLNPMGQGLSRGESTYLLASSARSLQDSVNRTNCCFCDLIHASLAMVEDTSMDREKYLENSSLALRSIVGDSIDVFNGHVFGWSIEVPPNFPQPRQIMLFTKDDDVLSGRIPGRSVNPTGSGQDSLRLAAQWVHDCFSNHNGCQRSTHMSGDPPWPTRVIDVGISDTDTVRLIVSDGTIKGKWAALSYRWGDVSSKSKETQSATMANLGSLQDEVPSNLLSATFLDAIRITRSLGLRYLWIDRLCILQDSDSDWMKEAAHMPLIYQNAQITIAAGSSNDGASGIFGNRKWAESSRQIDLPILSEEEISRVSIDFDTDLFQSSLESNCLNSRAWCFQEAQLSRRRLVFDREQTSFVCLQHGLQEKWASIEKVHPSYGFLVNKEPKLYKPIQSCTRSLHIKRQRDYGLVAEDYNHLLRCFFLLKSTTRTLARKATCY